MAKVTPEEIEKRFRALRERIGKYSPDQARDDNGRFASQGGGASAVSYSGYLTGAYESHEAMATVMHQHKDRVTFLTTHAKAVKVWAFSPTTRKLLMSSAIGGAVTAGLEIPLHLAVEHVATGLSETLGIAGLLAGSAIADFLKGAAHTLGVDLHLAKDWAVSTVVNMIGVHEKFAHNVAGHLVKARRYKIASIERVYSKMASANTIGSVALRELLYQLQNYKVGEATA